MLNLILAATVSASSPPATPQPQHLPTIRVRDPKATLTLQVASTEPERELGLMSVTNLPPHTGMLFVLDNDGPVDFWMKDTFVPLDMVFVGPDCVVRRVYSNVPATKADTADVDIPHRDGTAKYVIELPANQAPDDDLIASTKLSDICAAHLNTNP